MSKELMRKIADHTLTQAHAYTDETANTKDLRRWHRWDWSIGVGFYGVVKANRVLQDDALLMSIKKWVDERLDKIPSICVNTCGVMPALLDIAEKYGFSEYEDVIGTFDDYVMNKALRTPCGAIAHSVIGSELPGEIWADTLFMCALYLAKRGRMLGNAKMLYEAGRQLYLHVDKLYDSDTGLFWHGYDDINNQPMGTLWGRGNAWTTVATVEILEILGRDFDNHESWAKAEILGKVRAQLDALRRYQLPNGMWATVINHPQDTYPESSVTAGTVYGVIRGNKLGYFHEKHIPMAEKALAALVENIAEDGGVLLGSTGTPIKEDATAYNNIPYYVTPFTQGLALMALTAKN